ncbi:MAG: hypothetical protein OSA97_02460 [Nevskia sp.]|nr:hypothetical protein [Nevskia sp.]
MSALRLPASVLACGLVAACAAPAVPPQPVTEPAVQLSTIDIGYADVAAARRALTARSDVNTRTEDGWLVVEVPAEHATWRFAPDNYLAAPAVVERRITVRDGAVGVETGVLCQGPAPACADLRNGVQSMNQQIRVQAAGPQGS